MRSISFFFKSNSTRISHSVQEFDVRDLMGGVKCDGALDRAEAGSVKF